MRAAALALQLLIASAISAAASGVLVLFLVLFTNVLLKADSGGMALGGFFLSLIASLFLGGLAIFPAVAVSGLPAFCAGGLLWHIGRSKPAARRPWFFAALGAATGFGAYLYLQSANSSFHLPVSGEALGLAPVVAFSLFGAAGAASGLIFRSAMYTVGQFVGDDGIPEG